MDGHCCELCLQIIVRDYDENGEESHRNVTSTFSNDAHGQNSNTVSGVVDCDQGSKVYTVTFHIFILLCRS